MSVKGVATHYAKRPDAPPSWPCRHGKCQDCTKLSCSCECHKKEKVK